MKAYGDDQLVAAALEGRLDELEPRLATTLGFLRKVTLTPWDLTAADLAPMREAGIGDAAIEEATRVCLCFNVIDRLADALDYETAQGRGLKVNVKILLGVGYSAAVIPGSPPGLPSGIGLRDRW